MHFLALLGQTDVDFGETLELILNSVTGENVAWVALTLGVVQLLMFVLKRVQAEFVKKWGALILVVASAVASVLALVVGGLSWKEALLAFVASSASTFLHNLMHQIGVLTHKEPAEE